MTDEQKPKIENLETPEQELAPEEAEALEGGGSAQSLSDLEQKYQFQLTEANNIFNRPPPPPPPPPPK